MATETLEAFDGVLLDGLQFCTSTYDLFERIRALPDGPARLRMRKTKTEKKLLEELFPICRYIQHYYRPGRYISIRWIDGNQDFDAELRQRGAYIDHGYASASGHLEVTNVMHANEHLIWKLLTEEKPAFAPEGITKVKGQPIRSEPVAFSGDSHVSNFAPLILEQLARKSSIAYPENTSLVVQCAVSSLYSPDEWDRLVCEIRRQMPSHNFREVLLFEGVREYTAELA